MCNTYCKQLQILFAITITPRRGVAAYPKTPANAAYGPRWPTETDAVSVLGHSVAVHP